MARKKTIAICWIEQNATDEIRTLAYHNGKGDVRTYPKDEYDPRVTMAQAIDELRAGDEPSELPFFDKADEAVAWMARNRRGTTDLWACQVHLPAARKLLRGVTFAKPVRYERRAQ